MAVESFLAGYRKTTATTYAQDLRPMVAWLGPERPLQIVENGERVDYFEPPDLVEYVNLALVQRDPPYAPATIEKHKKTLRTFWNWCAKHGYVNQSPFAVPSKKLARGVDPDKIMPDAKLDTLLTYARWEPRRYALVTFLADTGCRRGGAAGLTIDRLDLGKRRATVEEKGEVSYTVYFGDVTARALRDWLSRRGAVGSTVFSRDGEPMTASALAQYFRRSCIAAGIGSWGPHSLRHRKGDQLQRSGVDPRTAARVLGHTNYMTTLDYYYHEDDERVEAASRAAAIPLSDDAKLRRFSG
jgi:integrase/recombinase XerD